MAAVKSMAPDEELYELGMSNFDHSIDDGLDAALKARPNEVFARHAGWDFNAKVWFDGEQFVSEPWHYQVPQELIRAASLRELMDATNEVWGTD